MSIQPAHQPVCQPVCNVPVSQDFGRPKCPRCGSILLVAEEIGVQPQGLHPSHVGLRRLRQRLRHFNQGIAAAVLNDGPQPRAWRCRPLATRRSFGDSSRRMRADSRAFPGRLQR